MSNQEPQKPNTETPTWDWNTTSWSHLNTLRQKSPLIQCITNLVSMDITANTLLSAGASPAMIHSVLEIPDFTPHAQGLVINIGTLTPDWLPGMKAAAGVANELEQQEIKIEFNYQQGNDTIGHLLLMIDGKVITNK
ncbi:hydroxyethylthiazole kinase [Artemisia annua]|uniref:hydroxyethylthiazole kinase n=1 Tax=Artemisia annua TaxID=35608 RepID=A0A2U1PLA6_ARTAN|nr:hydroxyethylthiazole kinase [Artemisia annua]